jgi:superfamily II DNA/RNA helicase
MQPTSFLDGLIVTDTMQRAMAADGITTATQVQVLSFAAIAAGHDVVLHSGTGTGKTLAYLLPVLQRLREEEGRVVVIAPGVELAMQTMRVANAYKDPELKTAAAVATTNKKRQNKRIQQSTRLVVGTTDRIGELLSSGKLKDTRILVFDEIDPILSARGLEPVITLLSRSASKLQVLVASATLSERAQSFIDRFMPQALIVGDPETSTDHAISHHTVRVAGRLGKDTAIVRFVQQNPGQMIIFVANMNQQSRLFHELCGHNIPTVTVSRQRNKQQRQAGIQAFRAGKARVLLTEDATGRGLDIPRVAFVLHHDVPQSLAAYVHRAGRTGRAGQQGRSVLFVDDAARSAVRRIASQLQAPITPFPSR